jgi:hypothetical protein
VARITARIAPPSTAPTAAHNTVLVVPAAAGDAPKTTDVIASRRSADGFTSLR